MTDQPSSPSSDAQVSRAEFEALVLSLQSENADLKKQIDCFCNTPKKAVDE